ncbi:MAG: hypothetical protein KC492_02125 [Myxococcales bacterium]|nr:hypothetical protein [Myxococcales bacterium]
MELIGFAGIEEAALLARCGERDLPSGQYDEETLNRAKQAIGPVPLLLSELLSESEDDDTPLGAACEPDFELARRVEALAYALRLDPIEIDFRKHDSRNALHISKGVTVRIVIDSSKPDVDEFELALSLARVALGAEHLIVLSDEEIGSLVAWAEKSTKVPPTLLVPVRERQRRKLRKQFAALSAAGWKTARDQAITASERLAVSLQNHPGKALVALAERRGLHAEQLVEDTDLAAHVGFLLSDAYAAIESRLWETNAILGDTSTKMI